MKEFAKRYQKQLVTIYLYYSYIILVPDLYLSTLLTEFLTREIRRVFNDR